MFQQRQDLTQKVCPFASICVLGVRSGSVICEIVPAGDANACADWHDEGDARILRLRTGVAVQSHAACGTASVACLSRGDGHSFQNACQDVYKIVKDK